MALIRYHSASKERQPLSFQKLQRNISSCKAAKIYKLILNRLTPALNTILRRNKNGSRKGRSTTGQILSIRRIVEDMLNANKNFTFIFVDFMKAFDSIHREVMFEVLALYGIPDKIIKTIKAMYTNIKSRVVPPDGETEYFDIVTSVLQGDTLAPFLFILVLDYVLHISMDAKNTKGLLLKPRRGTRHPAEHITDLDFSDDLAIISNTVKNAQSLIYALEEASAYVGLYCNDIKTEFVSTETDPKIVSFAGKTTKHVPEFKYLGSYIMNSGKDLKIRKALAWKACNKLEKNWRSNMRNNLKLNLFRSIVEPLR